MNAQIDVRAQTTNEVIVFLEKKSRCGRRRDVIVSRQRPTIWSHDFGKYVDALSIIIYMSALSNEVVFER